jgi:hypothetical protein
MGLDEFRPMSTEKIKLILRDDKRESEQIKVLRLKE